MIRPNGATDTDHRLIAADNRVEKCVAFRAYFFRKDQRRGHDNRTRMKKRPLVDIVHFKDIAERAKEED